METVDSESQDTTLQSSKLPSASKSHFNNIQIKDVCEISSEDSNQNVTIVPNYKFGCEDMGDISSVLQVTTQLKEKLSLKSCSGINGIVNGLAHTTSLEHDSLTNGETVIPSASLDKCGLCKDCERSINITAPQVLKNSFCSRHDCSTSKENILSDSLESRDSGIRYVSYKSELQMPDIMRLIQKDLSEPYSIYTYRYFIHNWPKLCFLAMDGAECIGAIVCKLDIHRKVIKRGYIAMLAVDEKYRKKKIGSNLVLKAIRAMVADEADEVVLETEITNRPALRLYENLGFVRDKRLFRYYLNGVDALRLKLWLR